MTYLRICLCQFYSFLDACQLSILVYCYKSLNHTLAVEIHF